MNMAAIATPVKPCVMIYIEQQAGQEEKVREIEAGLEEEGIPYLLVTGCGSHAAELAYQGAAASPLGVGIGIHRESLCIHYHRLPPEEPLFRLDGSARPEDWRRVGYNAARLVKGTPFKEMEPPEPVKENDGDLPDLINQIICRILQEQRS
ncbi:diol/glycerol dehydratase/dehydratase reactivating factor [Lucifera butyrica]|uniref:Diol/glycerol dehydratase/dehydratase reactivating factor n=1 Tax=Lucifera butyrica TaxID=1351585 RepID=A0A498R3C5_9FIRM|nr:glycerol dehydratase reactivase beta/small subunit family protein [Lucifera butyrica]VBB05300.1 diol/glycerol dehydratase/dehydratase reactivating factor [Lucifera butyrica]